VKRNAGTGDLSYYQWHVARWINSRTRAKLDWSGRGLFREILDRLHAKGKLPFAPQELASMIGATAQEIEAIWPIICVHFSRDPHDAESFRFAVSDMVRAEYERFLKKRRENGRKGGKSKSLKNQSDSWQVLGENHSGSLNDVLPKTKLDKTRTKLENQTPVVRLSEPPPEPPEPRAARLEFSLSAPQVLIAAMREEYSRLRKPTGDRDWAKALEEISSQFLSDADVLSRVLPAFRLEVRSWQNRDIEKIPLPKSWLSAQSWLRGIDGPAVAPAGDDWKRGLPAEFRPPDEEPKRRVN
jgi:hypothetical protein